VERSIQPLKQIVQTRIQNGVPPKPMSLEKIRQEVKMALNRNYLPFDGKAPNSPPKFL